MGGTSRDGSIKSAAIALMFVAAVSGALFHEKMRGTKGLSENPCTETCMTFSGVSPLDRVETSVSPEVELGAGGRK